MDYLTEIADKIASGVYCQLVHLRTVLKKLNMHVDLIVLTFRSYKRSHVDVA